MTGNSTLSPREDVGGWPYLHFLSKRAHPQNMVEGADRVQGLMCLARDVDVNGRLESEFTLDDLQMWYSSRPYAPSDGRLSTTGSKWEGYSMLCYIFGSYQGCPDFFTGTRPQWRSLRPNR